MVGTGKDVVAAAVAARPPDWPTKESFDNVQHIWVCRCGLHEVGIVAEAVPLPNVPATTMWQPADARADGTSRPRILRTGPRLAATQPILVCRPALVRGPALAWLHP
eukprot:SAG31_NODE_35775_length_320_cov_0.660633_1_plen_106_part_11